MKSIFNYVVSVFIILAAISCSNDENPTEDIKSDAKQILSFVFLASENSGLEMNIAGTINESNKTIDLTLPSGTAVNSLTAEISISAKATISPTGPQNYTNPIQFTVTAEDGSKSVYTAHVSLLSGDATLESIEPESGPKGTLVTINGTNFGNDVSKIQVYFNDMEAAITEFSSTAIIAAVPPRAYSGTVKVVIDGVELVGPIFNYTISEITVSTFVGNRAPGMADGMGTDAQFSSPGALIMDANGTLFVADVGNGLIRKVTPDGMVTTFAGTAPGFLDGSIDVAQFNNPTDMVFDENGNMYVADASNYKIRKISPDGIVSTLAGSIQGYNDGTGATAQFNLPHQLILDSNNNLVVSDFGDDKIRKVTLDGVVSTFAGSSRGFADGIGTAAMFNAPLGMLEDENKDLFVVDYGNHKIRRISETADVTTFAGSILGYLDGTKEEAQFFNPSDIAKDQNGVFYITDGRNRKIRIVTSDGMVSTLAGTTQGYLDGPADTAQFEFPAGIVIDSAGVIYVSDQGSNCIRKIIRE